MLRLGLVGTGDAGRHHARALAAAHGAREIEWTVVGARDVERVEARRGELGIPASVTIVSSERVLDGALCDAVIIATPDGHHHAHTSRALRAGLHVLVEKPLALSVSDAADLAGLAMAADRVLAVGYHLRHHAGHQLARERLAELVGTVRHVYVRWAWPDPATDGWRAHGQQARWWSLAALGTHAIDLVLWLLDDSVAEIAAICTPAHAIDRAVEVSLRLEGGALAHVSCAVTHRARPTVTIAGEAGELELVGTLGARGAGAIVHRAMGEIPFTAVDPYLQQLLAFVARCRGAVPRIDRHAITNIELLERIKPT